MWVIIFDFSGMVGGNKGARRWGAGKGERMAKGYWIAQVDVADAEAYKAYIAAAAPVFARYGARFIVRGGQKEVPEGQARARVVVVEFPSYTAAQQCYHSADYAFARTLRVTCSVMDGVIIEGYDGPQPGE